MDKNQNKYPELQNILNLDDEELMNNIKENINKLKKKNKQVYPKIEVDQEMQDIKIIIPTFKAETEK